MKHIFEICRFNQSSNHMFKIYFFLQMQGEISTFQDFITTTGTEFDQIRNQLQKHETQLLPLFQTIACIESRLKDHESLLGFRVQFPGAAPSTGQCRHKPKHRPLDGV